MINRKSSQIDDIEVLRAVAIILVIIAHIGALYPWSNKLLLYIHSHFAFWGGVDLFFAISGFVIARSLFALLEDDSIQLTYWQKIMKFWMRRFFRIVPSAWAWLMLVIIFSIIFNETGVFKSFWVNFYDMIAAMFNVANFYHFKQMQDQIHLFGANSIYWSLSLEEQFYLLLPLLLFFTKVRENMNIFVILLVFLILVQFFIPRPQGSILWEIRSDAIMFGVLIAIFSQTSEYKNFLPIVFEKRIIAISFFILMILGIITIPANNGLVPFYTGMLALLSAILVLVASYNKDYFIKNKILKTLLLWIGSRSFAIYLLHTPAFHLTKEIWYRMEPNTVFNESYTLKFSLTALFIIIILSELNFRFLEIPIRKFGRRYSENYFSVKE